MVYKALIIVPLFAAADSHGSLQSRSHTMSKFDEFTGSDGYGCQRILSDHSGNACLFFNQRIQTT